jgi:hypothetical protein
MSFSSAQMSLEISIYEWLTHHFYLVWQRERPKAEAGRHRFVIARW